MDLRDLLLALRRFWIVAVGVAVLIFAIGWSAAFLPQKTYRSVATIVMDFSPAAELSIQEVNFLLPALEERAQSQRLRDAAEAAVPELLQRPQPAIDATIDTSVLRIGATATRPAAAQAWADAVAEQLIEEREGVPPLALELLEPAPLRVKPVAPNVLPIMMATMVVALVAAVFSALAAERAVTLYRQSFQRVGSDDDDPDAPDDSDQLRHDERAYRRIDHDDEVDRGDGARDDGDGGRRDGASGGEHDVAPGTVGTARHHTPTSPVREEQLLSAKTDVVHRDEATPAAARAALEWEPDYRRERLRALLVPMVAVGGLIVLAAVLTMALMLVRAL